MKKKQSSKASTKNIFVESKLKHEDFTRKECEILLFLSKNFTKNEPLFDPLCLSLLSTKMIFVEAFKDCFFHILVD